MSVGVTVAAPMVWVSTPQQEDIRFWCFLYYLPNTWRTCKKIGA